MKYSAIIFLAASLVVAAPSPIPGENDSNYAGSSVCGVNGLGNVSPRRLGNVLDMMTLHDNAAAPNLLGDYGMSKMLGCSDSTAVWLSVASLPDGQQPTGSMDLGPKDAADNIKTTYADCFKSSCCGSKSWVPSFIYLGTHPYKYNLTVHGDQDCKAPTELPT